ncbi:MAG: CocE/NonD family hydrolase [Marinovum sp.]|nr:CocE/NonD family hydrolase [Marinovum sp.]
MTNLIKIIELSDMPIFMPDGTRLSARVWRPENAETVPVPAILEFLPYRKRDGTTARDCLTHPYIAKRGYACIRVDMRGNGESQGIMEDEYTEQELCDAEATIIWLAAQPWCSGTVGMMGISWGGFNALQVAARQPAALKAIITLCSTVDRYADDIHFKGGCLLNENLGWGATMWAYSSRPPDPALMGDAWREMWLQRLEAEPFLPMIWLDHQNRDAYWHHGSVCEDYQKITAATLAIGGWGDGYKNTVSHLVENLTAPVKGIVGPWVHKYPHFAVPEPRIGFLQESLRWWDYWLKGRETGVLNDPSYTVYLMDGVRPQSCYKKRSGHWIVHDKWPKDLEIKRLFFHKNSSLADEPSNLSTRIASPQTCGGAAGEYCAIWLGPEMPTDQRVDDALSACFTSEPITDQLDMVGAPIITLRLSSEKPAAQIAVRLNHIHPDGASTRITYGVLNLCHRNGHAVAEPLIPDEIIEISLTLDQIAYRIPKGHRICIAVSSTYWPLLWPSPAPVELLVHAGAIDIPVRLSGNQDERIFPPAETDSFWQIETLRSARNERHQSIDMASGAVTLEILDDFGSAKDLEHDLVHGSVAREWWSIHPDDPLSASGRIHWTCENSRDAWSVRTETYSSMISDAQHFYLTARLEAYENDHLIFEKDLSKKIKREHR